MLFYLITWFSWFSFSYPNVHNVTVVINTWHRPLRLKTSIEHYSKCTSVNDVRIVWSESTPKPADTFIHNTSIKYRQYFTNSINNRFQTIPDINTPAIFSVDDDVLVGCTSLQRAIETWSTSTETIVGFVARTTSEAHEYQYFWRTWWTGRYNMILTKAAVFHKKYLEYYTEHAPKRAYKWIDKHNNCEDILMSFMIANKTRMAPIWISGHYYDSGAFEGLSMKPKHKNIRTECVQNFTKDFGYNPLVYSYQKVYPVRTLWPFGLASTWLEWFSPI